MAKPPFKADSILLGKTSNIIEKTPDGDMIFRDSFVEGITLSQLLGGTVTLAPAAVVSVASDDWTTVTVDSQTRYQVQVPYPWADLCEPKVQVNIWKDDVLITLNKVQFENSYVLLESTAKIDITVILKRL